MVKFPMDRPVKIVMLGAGGTGGYVAPYLFRLLHMLDRPARFVICDGDIVELKNLDRQNFVPADLGENKARILAERYSTVLGSGVKRPLLPLSISQIGLIGGSGMINGLIECDTPHIIKGRIIKVVRTESEEKFNYRGDHMGSEIKETISNKMIFNVLTPNGFKALT